MKYMDKVLSSEERAKELLKIMTTEEKLAQLRTKLLQNYITDDGKVSEFNDIGKEGIGGFTFERIIMPYSIEEEAEIINAIHKKIKEETRLGIPPIINAEALHGLCLRGTTSFPQAIGLAATWDRDLMQKVAGVIASECKARGIRQVLSPTVDIARDLRWGRVEETYGEDAVLTSEMAVAFCKAFEEIGIITTPKHFVANSGDGGRDSAPVYHSEKILKQVYFKPYAACFNRAGSRSVMASYNALNGVPAGLNRWLLTDMLKKYMGFKGFTVTDYGLMEKAKRLHKVSSDMSEIAARAVKAGLHRELPDDGGYLFLNEALSKGLINEEEINRLVTDILRVKFEIGLFDDSLKYDGKSAQKLCNCPEHRDVAYKAAQKSIVLLKNDGVLPLKSGKTAIVGSYAGKSKLGGYSTWGIKVPSISEVFEEADYIELSKNTGEKEYSVIEKQYFHHYGENGKIEGINGGYKPNSNNSGQFVFTRNDGNIDFDWRYEPVSDKTEFRKGKPLCVTWNGTITVPQSRNYAFCIRANGGVRLSIDGERLIDRLSDTVSDRQTACYYLEKGKDYGITVNFSNSGSEPYIKLMWDYKENSDTGAPDYREIFRGYSNVIVTASITEGEGSDRGNLDLPHSVEKLICDIADTGKKVITVISAGSAVTMNNWIDKASAVVYVWYGGCEGSRALRDVIYGKYNPAGRLPVTFPQHVAQLPMYYSAEARGRSSGYNNIPDTPQFEFGYGLSYTEFEYSNIRLSDDRIKANEKTSVTLDIRNVGDCDGEEVVQLYINDLYSSVVTPPIELKDFRRVFIKRGATERLSFEITPEMLQTLDENLNWIVEPGEFEILIGASCKDIRQKTILIVDGDGNES